MPTTPYVSRADALALIVEQRSNEILARARETSVCMATFRSVPVSSRTLKMAMVDSFPSAQWLLAGTAPDDDVDIVKKPTTDMTWTSKDLTAEEAAVIVVIPENVIDDVEINLWAEVEARCSEAIAKLIDATLLFGEAPVGSIPPSFPAGGIHGLAVAAGNEVPGTGNDLAEDLNSLLGLVEADGFDASQAYSGTGVRAQLRGLRDSNGQFLYSTSMQGGSPSNVIWGVPITYVTNGAWNATKSAMIAGDPTMAVIGMRQALVAKRLDQATVGDINLAERDALALRMKIRIGFTVVVPKGVGSPAGNPFPFATLKPGTYPPPVVP